MLFALLWTTACVGVPVVAADTDNESTTTATSLADTDTNTDTDSGTDTSATPIGWPEDWYGDYYEEPGVNLGQDYPGQHVDFTGFWNIRLDPEHVTFEHFNTGIDGETHEWPFAVELDGDVAHLLPPGGEWDILYPGADDVLLRPGVGCDDIVLEVHGREPPYDPLYSSEWSRGRLCLLDPYDDSLCCDTWMLDLCPDTATSCSTDSAG